MMATLFRNGLREFDAQALKRAMKEIPADHPSIDPQANVLALVLPFVEAAQRKLDARRSSKRRALEEQQDPGYMERSRIYAVRSESMVEDGTFIDLYEDPLSFYVPLGETYWPPELIGKIGRRLTRGYGVQSEDDPRGS
jgi:hypothetical protein